MTDVLNILSQQLRRSIYHCFCLRHILPVILLILIFLLSWSDVYACGASTTDGCPCVQENIEPQLKSAVINSPVGAGFDIVNAILGTINGIMGSMAMTFYNNIIAQPNYQNAVNSLVILYVTIYGILILFSLASARTGEVVGRLIKIGIVWSIMGPGGWTFFSTYVGQPVINSINELITAFSNAGSGSPIQGSVDPNSGALSTSALESMFGPMTLVFSTTFAIMMIALMSTPVGWFMVFAIIWGLVEFLFMLIGAIITYVKAIVGLAFLFGLAPIFFSFILFDKTKQVFMGWVNQVLGFFLTPVLLFAFLGFYSVLLFNILHQILFSVDYCWVTFIKIGIFDVHWWRPINADNTCSNLCANGGDWAGGTPVMIIDTLYFLLLTHLGKNLSHFIEQIARDISGGSGPGVTRGDAVGRWFANNFAQGRGPGGIARDMFNAAGRKGRELAKGAAARRQKIGEGMKKGIGAAGKGLGAAAAGAAGAAGAGAQKMAKAGVRSIMHPVQTSKDVAGAAAKKGREMGSAVMQTGRDMKASAIKTVQDLDAARKDFFPSIGRNIDALGERIDAKGQAIRDDITGKFNNAQAAFHKMGDDLKNARDQAGQNLGKAAHAAGDAFGKAAYAVQHPGQTTGAVVHAAFEAGDKALHAAGHGIAQGAGAVGHGIAHGTQATLGGIAHGTQAAIGGIGHGLNAAFVQAPLAAYNNSMQAIQSIPDNLAKTGEALDRWTGYTNAHPGKPEGES